MAKTDIYFEQVYNKKLLRKLWRKYGPIYHHHVDLTVNTSGMLNLMDKMKRKKRRGEVVMVIPNKKREVWLHTKEAYGGVYRLMTGGLDRGEKPQQALRREVYEETGIKREIDRCLAVILYTLKREEYTQPFVSYVFITRPSANKPKPTDTSEAISGFKAIPPYKLQETAEKLRTVEGDFADWGKFRAVSHEVTHKILNKM